MYTFIIQHIKDFVNTCIGILSTKDINYILPYRIFTNSTIKGKYLVHFHDFIDLVRQFQLFPTPIIQNDTYYIIKEALHMNDISEDVRLAGQGSSEAFARLYSTVYKDMYHIALYSLRNSHDACDAVSDAVLDAFSSIKKLNDPSKFRSWIMTILSAKIKRRQKEYFSPAESIDDNTTLTDEFSYDNVELSEALEKLDIGYIDMMLLHHPGTGDVKAYQAMERYVEEGKIRSLGLSNWYREELTEFLPQISIMPALIQNEIHPYYQEQDVVPFIQEKGIVVQCWYPLGGRGYTAQLLGDETITEIAQAHGVSSAQGSSAGICRGESS